MNGLICEKKHIKPQQLGKQKKRFWLESKCIVKLVEGTAHARPGQKYRLYFLGDRRHSIQQRKLDLEPV